MLHTEMIFPLLDSQVSLEQGIAVMQDWLDSGDIWKLPTHWLDIAAVLLHEKLIIPPNGMPPTRAQ